MEDHISYQYQNKVKLGALKGRKKGGYFGKWMPKKRAFFLFFWEMPASCVLCIEEWHFLAGPLPLSLLKICPNNFFSDRMNGWILCFRNRPYYMKSSENTIIPCSFFSYSNPKQMDESRVPSIIHRQVKYIQKRMNHTKV